MNSPREEIHVLSRQRVTYSNSRPTSAGAETGIHPASAPSAGAASSGPIFGPVARGSQALIRGEHELERALDRQFVRVRVKPGSGAAPELLAALVDRDDRVR